MVVLIESDARASLHLHDVEVAKHSTCGMQLQAALHHCGSVATPEDLPVLACPLSNCEYNQLPVGRVGAAVSVSLLRIRPVDGDS